MYTIIAQAIGIVAALAVNISFQFKKKSTLLLVQLVGNVLFAINFFMLGAYVGGLLNTIAIVRALVYLKKDSLKVPIALVNAAFIVSYFIAYALTFTVFGKDFTLANAIVELLPVIGMTALTFGFAGSNAKAVRLSTLINCPCWMAYNIINFTLGGILCETLCLGSLVAAILRLDVKKDKPEA